MRVPKAFVPAIAGEIVKSLCDKKFIEIKATKDEVIKEAGHLILEELTIEDRVNSEVREILKKYDAEIEKGRLDYKKLFDLTKQKLVKERNIIL